MLELDQSMSESKHSLEDQDNRILKELNHTEINEK